MNNVQRLLTELSQPAAYPFAVDRVEVQQTHISIVFLAGPLVYKIKKPVQLGFLDFSTLERRKHFCAEEVRLNRRLAPDVYLGVVPVVERDGGLHFEGKGEPIEWAVKMRCLPHEATLESRLEHGEVTEGELRSLARRLAQFHAEAATNEHIASFGTYDLVMRNCVENIQQTTKHIGTTVHPIVADSILCLMLGAVMHNSKLLDARAARGVPRDTHGDLRLDHAYHFADRTPPDDWIIIDCIEFNERFRYADPIADVAFLVMDLAFHGRRDLARVLVRAYIEASGDADAEALFPLYVAYRAMVRAKVEGIKYLESEVPEEERQAALQNAKAYWLFAHSLLQRPEGLPFVILIAGLPGTGKSTLGEALTARLPRTVWLRSDLVRKELAGASADQVLAGEYYIAAWSARVYEELARRTVRHLAQGERVIIDANFRQEAQRRMFLDLAVRWGVPAIVLHCQASEEVVKDRLRRRTGDVSDADWNVYRQLAATWEPPGEVTQRHVVAVDADQPLHDVVQQALRALERSAWL